MRSHVAVILVVVSMAVPGCSTGPDKGIGPNGGSVSAGGAGVEVPAGALKSVVNLVVDAAPTDAPSLGDLVARGQVFAFLPHGQTFETPVEITVPFTAADAGVELYTAAPGGSWEKVDGATVSGTSLHASVSHFSYFAGAIVPDPLLCGGCNGQPESDGSHNCAESYYSARDINMGACGIAQSVCQNHSSGTWLGQCPSGASLCCKGPIENDGSRTIIYSYGVNDPSGAFRAACLARAGTFGC